jgi:hypothetical protein
MPELIYGTGEVYSQSGIINLVVGVSILVLSNGLAYLLVKTFKLPSYYGRFIGGIIIIFFTLLLALSTDNTDRFKSSGFFGIGEILIGGLDIISNRLSTSLPLLIPDPGC